MDGTRFDQLAKTVAARGSRRLLLGALLAGVLGNLRLRTTVADDSGTAIADASGGNHNLASAADQASGGQDHDHNHDRDHDDDHDHDRDRDNNHDGDHTEAFCREGVTECQCPPEGRRIACALPADGTESCQCDGDVCQPTGPSSTVATSCCSCDPDAPPGT